MPLAVAYAPVPIGPAPRYQPAARLSYNSLQVAAPPEDQATLLHALLDQRIVWADAQPGRIEPHEAITIDMQALRGVGE